MFGYPLDLLHEEVAFLAYYFHWNISDILILEHHDRKLWCEQISKINQKMNDTKGQKNISIEEV